jgi:protein MAK16
MDREKKGQKEKLKGDTELELENDETDEDENDGVIEDEDEWGEKEFVSDLSGTEDGLSDLEDIVVRAGAHANSRALILGLLGLLG